MKLSQVGLGATRLENIDTQFPAQDILIQSGQLVQYAAGVYGYHNIPLRVRDKIEKIIKRELDKKGCVEVLLPTLQPNALWERSGRLNIYVDDGTMMTVSKECGEFCLAPTAEEVVLVFAKTKIKSYKDMPVTLYQIGEKYRNELRARGFLLRGKSFPMMDAYSFDVDEEGLVKSYNNIRSAYIAIYKSLGLSAIPVAADNGGMGGKKSEEFMLLSEIGEDTILYDKETGKAFNSEILEKEGYEDYLRDEYGITNIDSLEKRRSVELGHIFQLGTKYSESMNEKFADKDGKEKVIQMGCYGIGVSRTLATIYEESLLVDDKQNPVGIALPTNLAPYMLQVIPKSDDEEKVKQAQELYSTLYEKGVEIIIDDRKDGSIGSKIKDAKILGTPYIAVLGSKVESGKVEVEKSKTGEKVIMDQNELIEKLIKLELDRQNDPTIELF